jgi:hypothetical protein
MIASDFGPNARTRFDIAIDRTVPFIINIFIVSIIVVVQSTPKRIVQLAWHTDQVVVAKQKHGSGNIRTEGIVSISTLALGILEDLLWGNHAKWCNDKARFPRLCVGCRATLTVTMPDGYFNAHATGLTSTAADEEALLRTRSMMYVTAGLYNNNNHMIWHSSCVGEGGSHVGVPQLSKAPGGIAVIPLLFKTISSSIRLTQVPMRLRGAPAPAPVTLNRCRGQNQRNTSPGHQRMDAPSVSPDQRQHSEGFVRAPLSIKGSTPGLHRISVQAVTQSSGP